MPNEPATIKAIADETMPYGVFVVFDKGRCKFDPTSDGRGGVLKRPSGNRNDCSAGENVTIQTDGGVLALFPDGATVSIDGVPTRIPAGNNYYCSLRDGRIVG
jgi:hypothetical protein